MKIASIILTFLIICSAQFPIEAQTYTVELQQITYPDFPALHSYAFARHEGKWLILGGRTNGLHEFQPPFAFPVEYANRTIYVLDPISGLTWSRSIDELPENFSAQLSSNNMEFHQDDNTLYFVGGYGVIPSADEFVTFPSVIAIDISGLMDAVTNETALLPHMDRLEDDFFAVCGGSLKRINGRFYLVGGQRFDGRYNPHDGPSFTQSYTNAIRSFNASFEGSALSIWDMDEVIDPANLHRRDYNLIPQIFLGGEYGLTAFSGVFQYGDVDVPWLNIVDITESTFTVHPEFEQLLNQYHTANMPVYDAASEEMHTYFFGGIGMYDIDLEDGSLYVDSLVPFVKNISRVSRYADGSVYEFKMEDSMPGFYGASAEFILKEDIPIAGEMIVDLNSLEDSLTLAGWIYGGILSTQKNIFMQFSGSSAASNTLFAVYIRRNSGTGIAESPSREEHELSCFPNPASSNITIRIASKGNETPIFYITDSSGNELRRSTPEQDSEGFYTHIFDLSGLPEGVYISTARSNSTGQSCKFLLKR